MKPPTKGMDALKNTKARVCVCVCVFGHLLFLTDPHGDNMRWNVFQETMRFTVSKLEPMASQGEPVRYNFNKFSEIV